MAKVTPILWTHNSNAKGQFPIYFRIADRDRTLYASTGVYVRESQWNPRQNRVRASHPNSSVINELISERHIEAEREIIRLRTRRESITAKHLKQLLQGRIADVDFFRYADRVVDQMECEGRFRSYKRHKGIIRKLRDFTGEPLPFDKLTARLLADFQTHLIEHYRNKPNTVAGNFRAIRAILYRAIREGYADQEKNPFFHFTIKHARPERQKLSSEELALIEKLDLKRGSLLWDVRNYFLFSFFCAGIRFGDLATLRQKNVKDGRLAYTMQKTGQPTNVKLLPAALAAVEPYRRPDEPEAYLFPLLDNYDTSSPKKLVNAIGSRNALVNKYLRKLADLAGIKPAFSFHVARHSFADVARTRGWSIYDISKALGHSSIKVTENYLKAFDQEALDEKMEGLFS